MSFVLASLRLENALLRNELEQSREQMDKLFADYVYTKVDALVTAVAIKSVYVHYRGCMRSLLVDEVVARYLSTVDGDKNVFDPAIARRIIVAVGTEANSGVVILSNGRRISCGRG